MWFYLLMGIICALGFLISYFTLKGKVKIGFCIGWGAVVLLSILFACFLPKTPVNPVLFDEGNSIDTLNKVVVFLLVIESFIIQLAVFFIFKKEEPKSEKGNPFIANLIIAILLVLFGIGWAVYTLNGLF